MATKKQGSSADARHVALLRGINVGGRNSLPMKDLARHFEDAGATGVVTYIQSGNVVFSAAAGRVEKLRATVRAAVKKHHGLDVPLVVLTREELALAVRNNPFLKEPGDQDALHAVFLEEQPAPAALQALDPNRSPPDRFVAKGRVIWLHLPNGMARTRITNAYLDSTLKTVSTARNWRTVLKLLELCGG